MGIGAPKRYSIFDFSSLFHLRNQQGEPYVLIGGQAVNYWAERYRTSQPELEELLPFTSTDIDFKGTREDVLSIASAVGRKPIFPPRVQMTALAGSIPIKIGNTDSSIEVVRGIPGVPVTRFVPVEVDFSGQQIRVIDPIALVESKLELLFCVRQNDRQDIRHLKIAILCVRGFLRETLELIERGEANPAGWLGAVNRIRKAAISKRGKRAAKEHDISWSFLPHAEIAIAKNDKIVRFRELQLVQWAAP
jgi:hypothetical protein